MYFKRKAYDKLLEWKKLYSENTLYCWKVQGGSASRPLLRPLQKMNIDPIF